MFVSMNWIKEYVDLSGLNIDDLIHRFTLSTAEVEDVYRYGAEINGVVVAEITSIENHPNSRKLHLLELNLGDHSDRCDTVLCRKISVQRKEKRQRMHRVSIFGSVP